MKATELLKGAAVLTAGSLLAKLIGCVYRVPLVGILGGYGEGLYQMAYPLFLLLLTFSSAGVPSAFSRVVARERARGGDARAEAERALGVFSLLGAMGSLLLFAAAPWVASLQRCHELALCIRMLSPSVFFVAVLAVLRGYFQGMGNMAPTAFSEVIEQLTKAAFGLFFATRFQDMPPLAAAYALLSVTISEAVAALALMGAFLPGRRRTLAKPAKCGLFGDVLPVMAATSVLPLSRTLDSVLLVRLLGTGGVEAYGLYVGGAGSLIGLISSVCYGLASASVPMVSAALARGEEGDAAARINAALLFTELIALPASFGLFFLAEPAAALLYPRLEEAERGMLVRLVKLCAVSGAMQAGADTLAACLAGMGRAKYAARNMCIAVAVKHGLQVLLVPMQNFGIFGAAIAGVVCDSVAFSLDLVYTKKKSGGRYDLRRKSRNSHGRADPEGAKAPCRSRRSARSDGRSFG